MTEQGSEPRQEDLEYWIHNYCNGDIGAFVAAQNSVKWLATRFPDRAEFQMRYWNGMRVGLRCDLQHLPFTTREEREKDKDTVGRLESVLKWLSEAGVKPPDVEYCAHNKTL